MLQNCVYLVLSAVVLFPTIPQVDAIEVFVTYDTTNKHYRIGTEKAASYVAHAIFNDTIQQTGWSMLSITTTEEYSDDVQAYAAGLAEGYLTRDLISAHWLNTAEGYCSQPLSPYCKRLKDFLEQNLVWMTEQIETNTNSSYWHQIGLFLVQLNALTDGYQNRSSQPSIKIKDPLIGLMYLQIQDDVFDLESVLHKKDLHHVLGKEKCSALIKLLPGNQDILIAHDTWSNYNTMLRIIKKYDFSFRLTSSSDSVVPGKSVTFSSYPGTLYSSDDFYITSANLVSLETTIGNYNAELWKHVKPTGQVLESIRNIISNRLADSVDQWVEVFEQYNSGTYNNEWMIVDYKKFKPGQDLPDKGLLMVLEQLPVLIEYQDMSAALKEHTYWASYNLPYLRIWAHLQETSFFEMINNMSGIEAFREKYGDFFSHENSSRARIFRRDHNHVVDYQSMIRMMRYNDFQNDPLSRCECNPPYSADNSISARNDLNLPNGTYHVETQGYWPGGGLDMKMTSYSMHQDLEMIAISGPTFQEQPPFRWSTSGFKNISHYGQPDLFKFDPISVKWN